MRTMIAAALGLVFLLIPTALAATWVHQAGTRLQEAAAKPIDPTQQVATAQAADVGYCTPDLKRILRRVLQSCGLLTSAGGRGCAPVDAKNVAQMTQDQFNALFTPLADRAGIIEFDKDSSTLDETDLALVNKLFSDQRGASYFFVVSRSSPDGNADHNRDLSKQRADSVLSYLRRTFNDPDLDKEVGLLSLGEEFAQLKPQEFCSWQRSGDENQCKDENINRSAFIAWIDCRL